MTYPARIEKMLKKANVEVGDIIRISLDTGTKSGILIPHHEFSNEDILTIKLDTGYNIGVVLDDISEIKLVEKAKSPDFKEYEDKSRSNLPNITILGTGGTIASYVDYRTGAVHPALNARDLAYSVPELAEIAAIKVKVLFSIFSENMTVTHWQKLAAEAALELNSGASGVIVAHGTDTMGYSSAALSFMLRNLTGPVILVGSQRSSDRPSSDASLNLISAARLAANSDLGMVVVVMHGETADSHVLVHRGTRVRKMHTSKRDAFLSINEEPLGIIRNSEIVLAQDSIKRNQGTVELHDKMEEKVSLIYTYPGMKPDIIDYLSGKNKGIVIAGTGLGHTPKELIESIKNAISSGVYVMMTSQCIYGQVNMKVYSTGRDLVRAGVISGEDMLPETALIKLMWVLGQTQNPEEVASLLKTNIAGEIAQRRSI